MASIYIIRHGQASFGADDYDKLSEKGEQQAELLGAFFLANKVGFDAVYAGELKRQQGTARGVLKAYANAGHAVPDIITDARLNECENDQQVKLLTPALRELDAGYAQLIDDMDGSSKSYQKIIEKIFKYWQQQGDRLQPESLQTWPQFRDNVSSMLNHIMQEQGRGKDSLVFTSGGVIAAATAIVLGLEDSHVYTFYEPVLNASVTRVLYNSANKMSLSYFNDHSYLRCHGFGREDGMVTYR